jgi:hypothetical protein
VEAVAVLVAAEEVAVGKPPLTRMLQTRQRKKKIVA